VQYNSQFLQELHGFGIFGGNSYRMRSFLLIVFLFMVGFLNAQSKKKQIEILTYRTDSLKKELTEIKIQKQNLEKHIQKNNDYIHDLTNQIEQHKSENKDLNSRLKKTIEDLNATIQSNKSFNELMLTNQNAITNLNNQINLLKDSLVNIKSFSNNKDIREYSSQDFLNNYFFNQIPLNNNSYKFLLHKVIIGNMSSQNDYSYRSDPEKPNSVYVPEILNITQLRFYKIKSNTIIEPNKEFNNYIELTDIEYFNSLLPKIEIIKNKLFVLKYPDQKEENFLFKSEQGAANNYRKTLKIILTREDNEAKKSDVILTLLSVDNECYLALDYNQIIEFNKFLLMPGEIEVVRGNEIAPEYTFRNVRSSITNEIIEFDRHIYGNIPNVIGFKDKSTENRKVYLSRRKDQFMQEDYFLNPYELILLFKLE
jgi:hypothetical protein